jgi:hypothetical protein
MIFAGMSATEAANLAENGVFTADYRMLAGQHEGRLLEWPSGRNQQNQHVAVTISGNQPPPQWGRLCGGINYKHQ